MGNQKLGPAMILNHQLVYQLLSDRLFWERNPGLQSLQELGDSAHFRAVENVLQRKPRRDCRKCGSTLNAVMSPFITALGQYLTLADEVTRQELADYIAEKRGYRPDPITLYYKNTEGVQLVSF